MLGAQHIRRQFTPIKLVFWIKSNLRPCFVVASSEQRPEGHWLVNSELGRSTAPSKCHYIKKLLDLIFKNWCLLLTFVDLSFVWFDVRINRSISTSSDMQGAHVVTHECNIDSKFSKLFQFRKIFLCIYA